MFTLRIIEEMRENENAPVERIENNHSLGKGYSKLKQGVTKEFDLEIERLAPQLKENWPNLNVKTEVDSIIRGENGDSWFIMKEAPLANYSYFIMTETGATFERL